MIALFDGTHTTFIFINYLVVIELIFQQLGIINKGVGLLLLNLNSQQKKKT